MKIADAIDTMRALLPRLEGDDFMAASLATDHLVAAYRARQGEIEKAVEMIRPAITDADGKINRRTWGYLRGRIGFPEEDKAEIARRLGLDPAGKE